MDKYLPIGSVCTLKGKNKKIMITGFYSVEFNGNLKINDYSGCAYPEGLLQPKLTCSFNHSDIEEVNFVGYQNEDQIKFNNLLKSLTDSETVELNQGKWTLSSGKMYSKILFDENGVVALAEPIVEEKNRIDNIKFDENGVVVSDGTSHLENPFYKNYDNVFNSTSNPENNLSNIKFDENGLVTSDESFNEKKEEVLSKIKFDENGVVISMGGEDLSSKENVSEYLFDENGYVTAVREDSKASTNNETSPEYKFDENGVVISVGSESSKNETSPEYTFDENGVVTGVN